MYYMEPFEVDGIMYYPPRPEQIPGGGFSNCQHVTKSGTQLRILLEGFKATREDVEFYSQQSCPA